MAQYDYDAVIVGAGPNGLAAAITLAQAGCSVLVLEGKDTIGGGARSAPLTAPGFIHDVCSAIHPLGVASPFFRSLPLSQYGLEWVHPRAALAHPLEDGQAVLIYRSIEATLDGLAADQGRYRALFGPLVNRWQHILHEFLGPLRFPRYPVSLTRFGVPALIPARMLAKTTFRDPALRAAFIGMAAHAMLPLSWPGTAAFGLMLGMLAHAVGWPMARGGSQQIVDAMAAHLGTLGGKIETGRMIRSLDDLPSSRAVLLNITPRQILQIAGDRLPDRYARALRRYRYGQGVFKIDYALKEPIPWRNSRCAEAATVHLGGSAEEIIHSEAQSYRGRQPDSPYTLVAQQTLFDATRAPEGRHTAWVYCHAPRGSNQDITPIVERQIERFAPGFRDVVLAHHAQTAVDVEQYNPNYIGGDINGGVQDLRQLFTRPVPRLVPYSTPLSNVYICSSSTPPGGGVHGMCGYFAARAALRYSLKA
jgi:phytoene dehydrogenase-like protein